MSEAQQPHQQIGIQSNSGGDISVERSQVNIAGRDMIIYQAPTEPEINVEEAERTYRSQVIKKYNSLSFSWFEHDVPSLADVSLEHIFVRLTLTVEKVIREPIPPEASSERKRGEERPRERVITVQEPIELDQALTQHLLIVGEPGAGKSTLLRWLAVTFAQERQREPERLGPSADVDRLPVLIELGHLPERYLRADGGGNSQLDRVSP
jgi:predicted NACHT family NTPase